MSTAKASIREIRTNFRSVERKLEEHGEVLVTDNGVPRFLLKSLPTTAAKKTPMPDYYARLVRHQPRPLSARQARKLHAENRGEH